MNFSEKYIETKDGLKIFTEAIGDAKNPAIVLLMGAMNQGIFWYDSFCTKLALAGFFVIRYDHRDTGLSSAVNYLIHPYNLNNLTDDVIEILDGYSIPKAHIVGISMGGFIGQLLAINHKERAQTLTLISTTADHRPYMDAVSGDFNNKYELPYPGKKFIEFVEKNKSSLPLNDKDFRNSQIEGWKIMFGDNFNQSDSEELVKLIDLSNTRNKNKLAPFNHSMAVSKSEPRLELVEKISVPTLIIHGDKDICFPKEHSVFLNQHISNSKLEEIKGMGHMFSQSESEIIAEKIIEFCQVH